MTIWRMRIARWIPKATNTHTHRIYNSYCFLTATMLAITRLNGTSHDMTYGLESLDVQC